EFQLVHFDIGIERAKYNFLDFPQNIEFITSSLYLEIMLSSSPLPSSPSSQNPNINLLFILESQAQNRKKILKDRNNTSSHQC
ncbi:4777_t:CDS:1, partial [Funneliformis mosseae]